MWTPAIERDRRIALQDRSTRFFGTDFSFEDLEERDVNQYDYALLGDDTVDGAACWKIQSTPRQTKSSQYTQVDRLDPQGQLRVRADRELRQGSGRAAAGLLTTSENVQGIWTAKQLEMTDVRRGSRTRLTLDKLEYNVAAERRRLHAAGDPPPVDRHDATPFAAFGRVLGDRVRAGCAGWPTRRR